jgi:hypothetical protein
MARCSFESWGCSATPREKEERDESWLLDSQSGTFGCFHRQKMFLIQLNKMKQKPGGMLPVKCLLLLSSRSHPFPHYHDGAHQAHSRFLIKMFGCIPNENSPSFVNHVSDTGAPELPGKADTLASSSHEFLVTVG